ncbi:phosphatase PAP2 family protein [Paenibacillus albiflavus]|nr:phosphatase PAP2 family protein [Paenibacillus albiflavus]
MMNLIKKHKPLLWILAIPVLNIFYMILNHGDATTVNLITDLDEHIPFVSWLIIPYVLWYPLILTALIILYVKNLKLYYRTLIALCMGLVISYIIYYFYQTTMPRPDITPDGLINSIVWLIYQTDQPYNCFPSIHVFTSYLVFSAIRQCKNVPFMIRFGFIISAWSVILSTLFVKQHVILDAAGGIVLAQFLYYIVGKCMHNRTLVKLAHYDKRIFQLFNQSLHRPFFNRLMRVITHLGGGIATIVCSVSVAIFAPGLWQTIGWQSVAALTFSHFIVVILKKNMQRNRPYVAIPYANIGSNPLKDSSFPSGHTTAIFAVVTPFLFITGSYGILLLLLAVSVALSRIHLGLHYPSDCIAGSVLGIGSALFMTVLIR